MSKFFHSYICNYWDTVGYSQVSAMVTEMPSLICECGSRNLEKISNHTTPPTELSRLKEIALQRRSYRENKEV